MTTSEYNDYLGQHSFNHKLLGNRRELMREYPRLPKVASKEHADKQIKDLEKVRKGENK